MQRLFDAIEYEVRDEVAVLHLSNPPVNGLSHAVRLGLVAAFEHAISDPRVEAIVLAGAGRGFSAGADIHELGSTAASAAPSLSMHVHPVIETCPKVTVAAMHGIAMGGGLETALVCHFRLAAADTRIALPEIKLGLIPLSGTQRLPRLLGLQAAIDFILEAKTVLARDFAVGTVFDAVFGADAQGTCDQAVAYARTAVRRQRESGVPLPRVRDRAVLDDDAIAVLRRARARAADMGPVALATVEAIAATVETRDFDAGIARARAIFDKLATSAEVHRRRESFLATRSNR